LGELIIVIIFVFILLLVNFGLNSVKTWLAAMVKLDFLLVLKIKYLILNVSIITCLVFKFEKGCLIEAIFILININNVLQISRVMASFGNLIEIHIQKIGSNSIQVIAFASFLRRRWSSSIYALIKGRWLSYAWLLHHSFKLTKFQRFVQACSTCCSFFICFLSA